MLTVYVSMCSVFFTSGVLIADLMQRYFIAIIFYPFLRVVRIGRILHIFRLTRGVRKLLLAFVKSLPALFNISFVLFVMMFIFSIIGMFSFAHVKREAVIDDMFNFETFWNSLICMFMVGPSSGWGGLLLPIMNIPPDCDPHAENPGTMAVGDCGSPVLGVAFFSSFIVLSFLLVIHLYIAVILGTFNSEDTEVLSDEDLHKFYKTWRKFDPDATQFIPYRSVQTLADNQGYNNELQKDECMFSFLYL